MITVSSFWNRPSRSTFLIVFADLILLIDMALANATVTSIIFMLVCTILTFSVAIYQCLNER